MNLIDTLEDVGAEIEDTIEEVNSGGCGVFAAFIARHLKKLGVQVVCRIGDYRNRKDRANLNDIRENEGFIKAWKNKTINVAHVIVEFTLNDVVYHYDSSGVTKAKNKTNNFGYALFGGHLTPEEAMELANTNYLWNDEFNRKQIPEMEEIINAHFEELVNSAAVLS